MENPCPFWSENRECASRHCGIENCDDEVPEALKKSKAILSTVRYVQKLLTRNRTTAAPSFTAPCEVVIDRRWSNGNLGKRNQTVVQISSSKEVEEVDEKCVSSSNQFDPLDRSLTEVDRATLTDMDIFEDTNDKFCDMGGKHLF